MHAILQKFSTISCFQSSNPPPNQLLGQTKFSNTRMLCICSQPNALRKPTQTPIMPNLLSQNKGNITAVRIENLGQHTTERCTLPQIRHQVINTIQMSPQKCLLLLCRPRNLTFAVGSLPWAVLCPIKRPRKLTWTPLQHRWH
jgi:hypothetical protein